MARIVKVKQQKRGINKFVKFFVVFALFASLFSNLVIKNVNNSLTIQLEDITRQSVKLKQDNDTLTLEIQGLISKDRVYDVAEEAGLVRQESNVKNVVRGE